MKALRKPLGSLLCFSYLVLLGCGSNPAPVSTAPASNVSPLAGNWLITGVVPSVPFPQNPPFSLAMTIDVNGNQLTSGESDLVPCTAGGLLGGAGDPASGTLAADGTFTLQSIARPAGGAPIPLTILKLSGTAPAKAQASWSGTYSFTPGSTTCTGTLTGSFTATPIQNVAGAFSGATTLAPLPYVSGAGTPVSLQLNLQQGAMVTSVADGTYYKASALTGTISVSGTPCFSHGTIATTNSLPSSTVVGSFLDANFVMDDGSTVLLTGRLTSADATQFRTELMTVRGGACNMQTSTGMFALAR